MAKASNGGSAGVGDNNNDSNDLTLPATPVDVGFGRGPVHQLQHPAHGKVGKGFFFPFTIRKGKVCVYIYIYVYIHTQKGGEACYTLIERWQQQMDGESEAQVGKGFFLL